MAIDFNTKLSPDDVGRIFKLILGRECSEQTKQGVSARGVTAAQYIGLLKNCPEFKKRFMDVNNLREADRDEAEEFEFYRVPDALCVSATPPRNVLLIGSCLMDAWPDALEAVFRSTKLERITVNRTSGVPRINAEEAKTYDFQIIQIPLRSLLPEADVFHLKYSDETGYQRIFTQVCERARGYLKAYMTYNVAFGLMTFVLNFPVPQQNLNGRLLSRYSFNNPVYFFEELNRKLSQYIAEYKNAYLLDFDQIAATFGRKRAMDDMVNTSVHGAFLSNIFVMPSARLEDPGRIPANDIVYPKLIRALFAEAVALKRTIEQTDSVKLVVFDLDDTLWRGVAAEMETIDPAIAEGWPMGMLEAVSTLWRRGVLVAIVSKNDESVVRATWSSLYGARFPLDHFVSTKINWRSKAENIAEIMKETNLLPGSVLFVDDNPVERANVRSAFPDIRTLEVPLVHWKRTLIFAPELQRAGITGEAAERTQMIQAQILREEDRVSMGEGDFLSSLETRIEVHDIASCDDKRFERCFELINKTNQFNTTGKRWTIAEFSAFFGAGGSLVAIEVKDKYTAYGLTVILMVSDDRIEQFVMSCRVFGMRVEHAALSIVCERIAKRGRRMAVGTVVPTEKNKICRQIFADCGFEQGEGGQWRLTLGGEALSFPETVRLVEASPQLAAAAP